MFYEWCTLLDLAAERRGLAERPLLKSEKADLLVT